jgi:hypothetical protein
LDRTLELIERGKLEVRLPELTTHLRRLEGVMRRLIGALIFAALLMGGVQLYVAEKVILGGILLGGAFIALIWAFFSGLRRRH